MHTFNQLVPRIARWFVESIAPLFGILDYAMAPLAKIAYPGRKPLAAQMVHCFFAGDAPIHPHVGQHSIALCHAFRPTFAVLLQASA